MGPVCNLALAEVATMSQYLPSVSSVSPPWARHRPVHGLRMQMVIICMLHSTETLVDAHAGVFVSILRTSDVYSLPGKRSEWKTQRRAGNEGRR